jgi:hypothetical protein
VDLFSENRVRVSGLFGAVSSPRGQGSRHRDLADGRQTHMKTSRGTEVRKLILLLVLTSVAFVCGANPANATMTQVNSIVFQDLTDSPTLSGPTGLSGCSFVLGTCIATLKAPSGYSSSGNITLLGYRLGEGSKTGNVSDVFAGGIIGSVATLTFTSDPPTAGGEVNGLGPCVAPLLHLTACNAVEDGTMQLVGTITWKQLHGTGTIIDSIYIASAPDVAVAPEPASLLLFGSGLGITAWFLRRRRRLVTPSF